MASIDLPSMAAARPPSASGNAAPRGEGARPAPRARRDWRFWWVVGLCFGLGYGVSHRLLNLGFEKDKGSEQRFDVLPFPGTSLDSLRQRFGGQAGDIRGDLDRVERERQQQQEAADIEKRRAAIDEREARQRRELLEGAGASDGGGVAPGSEAGAPAAPALPPPQAPPASEREAPGPAPAAPPPPSAPPAPEARP
ncbi:MAG: hypothetical protein ER33_09660 [Cyanobium sp. CACIAM 14]|nr:MAG: hypothetical protein ER33_09660 [Cyanobium sp. CACIAM 14]